MFKESLGTIMWLFVWVKSISSQGYYDNVEFYFICDSFIICLKNSHKNKKLTYFFRNYGALFIYLNNK